MAEELKTILVPITDGTVTKYEETYVLSEFNLVQGGTGNATVPNDAPIQPLQAFVDASYQLGVHHNHLDLPNKSISQFATWISEVYIGYLPGLDLSGNLLSQSEVDSILSYYGINIGSGAGGPNFNLSGSSMASPTNGAANADAWLITIATGGDFLVKFNLHGLPVTISASVPSGDFSGNSMSASEVNALLAFLVANHADLAWTLDISGGTNSDPTGQGLTDKTTLEGNGWTIYTHSNPPP